MTKRVFGTFVAAVICLAGTVAVQADQSEDDAIVAVVDRAYVQGVHVDQDPEKMRSGMHESFVMFVQQDGGVMTMTRDAWIERIEAANAKRGSGEPASRPETTASIDVLDRAGDAAVVKVDLFRDGEQIFTDYISLYKFEDGWKLVGKTFHRH